MSAPATPLECPMAPLIEAERDGRLGARESASLARHLGTCASCRELERDLDEVRALLRRPGAPLTVLEHQRGRLALLRAAASPPASRRLGARTLRRAALAGAGLAIAAGVLVGVRPAPPAVPLARHLPAITVASALAVTTATAPPDTRDLPPREAATEVSRRAADRSRPAETSVSVMAAGDEWQAPRERSAAQPSTIPASSRRPVAVTSRPLPEQEGAASRSFRDAVDLLGRGDYAAARAQLEAFRAAHPADGRADLAAFLTIVTLQRAGRRAEAQEAARRYLALYPDGDRRADAARVASGR